MKKKRAVDSIAVGRNSTAGTHRHRNVMKCRIAAFLLQGQESRIINNVTTRIHDNMLTNPVNLQNRCQSIWSS